MENRDGTPLKEVKLDTEIVEKKTDSNKEIAKRMERYNGFARSLFGDDYEVGKVKVAKGYKDPRKITMLKLEEEFKLEQQARGNSEDTIKTYSKHFHKLYDFLGMQYLRQSPDIVDYVLEHSEEYGTMREIGASMPVLVLQLDNFIAYYQRYLREVKKNSEQTIISSMRHARAIIYFAQEKKWIEKFSIKVRDKEPDIKQTFTDYELKQLSRKPKVNKDTFTEYRCYVMVKYLLATGNRIGSILALNVGDIDFERGEITVNIQKNKKPKIMPLNYDLRRVLREWIYHYRCSEDGTPLFNEPLFCNRTGERLTYDGASDAMQDYFKARRVEWSGFHKFRHSYASYWIRDGGNPLLLKEQLGHSSLVMTNRYANLYGMATKEEAEAHSLIKKYPDKVGRKQIKFRE